MSRYRWILPIALALVVALFFLLDAQQYFSLDYLKSQQAAMEGYYSRHPARMIVGYFVLYLAIAGLSLPGFILMALLGGALFGTLAGTLIASFATSIGATLAFLSSRYLFRDGVQRRYGDRLRRLNEGIVRDGGFYLFTLRMIHVVPFFAINLAMGLTPIRTWTFYWVSQIGMLTGTLIYVNAGTQLAQINSARDALSARSVVAMFSLALVGLISSRLVDVVRAVRVYTPWRAVRPAVFDRDLVVIGRGPAGFMCASIAAALKAKVTLVECPHMGGEHVDAGWISPNALIRSSRLLALAPCARELGLRMSRAEVSLAAILDRARRVIEEGGSNESSERYAALGVERLQGEARIASPWHVEVTGEGGKRVLTTRGIVIASGARPAVPAIPGIDEVGYVTSETLSEMSASSKRLLVLGAGPTGTELAQAFARVGRSVTLVESAPRILPREDVEVSELLTDRLRRDGVRVLVNHKACSFRTQDGQKLLIAEAGGTELPIAFDQLLCAAGRVPRTQGLGLNALGIRTTAAGAVETDGFLRTIFPNITACGAAAGAPQYTDTAPHSAYYATVNALFGGLRRRRVDRSAIPRCLFTEPEVACVGLSTQEAALRDVPYAVTLYPLRDPGHAIGDGEVNGFVKVLTVPHRERILGATIVARHAADMIPAFILAMRHGLGVKKILPAIQVCCTGGEADRSVSGRWRREDTTQAGLGFLERFQAWRRR